MLLLSLLVIAAAVLAILFWQAEVRLTLTLAALALGALAGQPEVIVRTFLVQFTAEQFLLPIGTCMGFAHVLKHTGCDQHLIQLLARPLRRARPLLIPGVVLVGAVVNVPIISQSSAAVAVGTVLAPVMRAASISPVTAGASLALGCSIGGELLNPGAPELNSIARETGATPIDCVAHVWRLLIVHVAVALPLFWLLCLRAGDHDAEAPDAVLETSDFRISPLKALVPLLPLFLLFLTALPEPLRALHVPHEWLVGEKEPRSAYGVRLIGAAMLVGVVVAALLSPRKAGGVGRAFFEGGGYALANITSLIVAANCFGVGVKLSGLAEPLQALIESSPRMMFALAAALPLAFGWVSGSGMASTESLYRFFAAPAGALEADPLRVGAVVAIGSAAGRTLSPVSAVVLMAASLNGTSPLPVVRRMALPLLAGLVAVVIAAMLLP